MFSSMSGAFEHTVVFCFFLFLFMVGALMAGKFVGYVIQPGAKSLGTALQSA